MAASKAVEKVFGVKPDLTREGGSIPVTLSFQDALQKNVLLLPMGRGDDVRQVYYCNIHTHDHTHTQYAQIMVRALIRSTRNWIVRIIFQASSCWARTFTRLLSWNKVWDDLLFAEAFFFSSYDRINVRLHKPSFCMFAYCNVVPTARLLSPSFFFPYYSTLLHTQNTVNTVT